MQRRVAKILCFKCRVIRDFTILFVDPSILRKLRLTCRTQDAGARGWLGRRRGQDAGRTRALCGPDAGRVDARRGPDAGRRSAKLFLGGTVRPHEIPDIISRNICVFEDGAHFGKSLSQVIRDVNITLDAPEQRLVLYSG